MKLVCKYCKEEITTIVTFQVEGKMKQSIVCVPCFHNYLKTMHNIDVVEDFKELQRQQMEEDDIGRKDLDN